MLLSVAQISNKFLANRAGVFAALAHALVLTLGSAPAALAQESASSPQKIVAEGYVKPMESWEAQPPLSLSQTRTGLYNQPPEIWVADISTHLIDDSDGDGYFAAFQVSMDIDVDWEWAEVYADIYLQPRGAAPRLLHTTQVFSIFERNSSDRYQVDVQLFDNTPTDGYDLIIDVVEVSSGFLVDSVSNYTHYNLANLPLESQDYQYDIQYETNFGVQVSGGNGFYDDVGISYGFSVQSVGHGGATGWLGLLGLAIAALTRLRRRPNI